MRKKILYLPLEIIGRELGAAVLLAEAAVNKGWTVVVGAKAKIFAGLSTFDKSPGVFLLKSIVPGEVSIQRSLLSRGHRIVSLDIEGLVPTEGNAGVTLRFSDESLELTDLVFFYGRNYLERVTAVYPKHGSRLKSLGAPAIEEILLRATKKKKSTVPPRKKAILIATSCVFSNSIMGKDHPRRMMMNAISSNGSSQDIVELEKTMELDEDVFKMWKRLIPKIADAFPDLDVIVRPHPTELAGFWVTSLSPYPNVSVDETDSILRVLETADVFLHFNSTSAVAAFLMDVPIIMPNMSELGAYSRWITYVKELSSGASSDAAVIEAVGDALSGRLRQPQSARQVLVDYCDVELASSASQSIIDALVHVDVGTCNDFVSRRQSVKESLINKIKQIKKTFANAKYKIEKSLFNIYCQEIENSSLYAKKKQPDMTNDSISSAYVEITGVEPTFSVRELKNNVFLLRRRETVGVSPSS